jgi:hypothetical protein
MRLRKFLPGSLDRSLSLWNGFHSFVEGDAVITARRFHFAKLVRYFRNDAIETSRTPRVAPGALTWMLSSVWSWIFSQMWLRLSPQNDGMCEMRIHSGLSGPAVLMLGT